MLTAGGLVACNVHATLKQATRPQPMKAPPGNMLVLKTPLCTPARYHGPPASKCTVLYTMGLPYENAASAPQYPLLAHRVLRADRRVGIRVRRPQAGRLHPLGRLDPTYRVCGNPAGPGGAKAGDPASGL